MSARERREAQQANAVWQVVQPKPERICSRWQQTKNFMEGWAIGGMIRSWFR